MSVRTHPLAHSDGVRLIMAIMTVMGSMCPECLHGTRRLSKAWAKCKGCGELVERRTVEEVDAMFKEIEDGP